MLQCVFMALLAIQQFTYSILLCILFAFLKDPLWVKLQEGIGGAKVMGRASILVLSFPIPELPLLFFFSFSFSLLHSFLSTFIRCSTACRFINHLSLLHIHFDSQLSIVRIFGLQKILRKPNSLINVPRIFFFETRLLTLALGYSSNSSSQLWVMAIVLTITLDLVLDFSCSNNT